MTAELPSPLVPADVNLRGFNGFMLDVDRLLSSELVATGSPEECWAALMLWCRSWKQNPPASLPDDEKVLAAFSGAGKRWPKVRAVAIRGFVKCSDGRLYHRVLAKEANDAWARRKKYQARSATANSYRHGTLKGKESASLDDPTRLLQGERNISLKSPIRSV